MNSCESFPLRVQMPKDKHVQVQSGDPRGTHVRL